MNDEQTDTKAPTGELDIAAAIENARQDPGVLGQIASAFEAPPPEQGQEQQVEQFAEVMDEKNDRDKFDQHLEPFISEEEQIAAESDKGLLHIEDGEAEGVLENLNNPEFGLQDEPLGTGDIITREAVGITTGIAKGIPRGFLATADLAGTLGAEVLGKFFPNQRQAFLDVVDQTVGGSGEGNQFINRLGETHGTIYAVGRDSYTEPFSEAVAPFMGGFAVAGRTIGKKGFQALGLGGTGKVAAAGRGLVKGAAADATIFDAHMPGLSNLMLNWGYDPAGIASALAIDENDSKLGNRGKHMIEGGIAGVFAEVVLASLGGVRRVFFPKKAVEPVAKVTAQKPLRTIEDVNRDIAELQKDYANAVAADAAAATDKIRVAEEIQNKLFAYDPTPGSFFRDAQQAADNAEQAAARQNAVRSPEEMMDAIEESLESVQPPVREQLGMVIEGGVPIPTKPTTSVTQAVGREATVSATQDITTQAVGDAALNFYKSSLFLYEPNLMSREGYQRFMAGLFDSDIVFDYPLRPGTIGSVVVPVRDPVTGAVTKSGLIKLAPDAPSSVAKHEVTHLIADSVFGDASIFKYRGAIGDATPSGQPRLDAVEFAKVRLALTDWWFGSLKKALKEKPAATKGSRTLAQLEKLEKEYAAIQRQVDGLDSSELIRRNSDNSAASLADIKDSLDYLNGNASASRYLAEQNRGAETTRTLLSLWRDPDAVGFQEAIRKVSPATAEAMDKAASQIHKDFFLSYEEMLQEAHRMGLPVDPQLARTVPEAKTIATRADEVLEQADADLAPAPVSKDKLDLGDAPDAEAGRAADIEDEFADFQDQLRAEERPPVGDQESIVKQALRTKIDEQKRQIIALLGLDEDTAMALSDIQFRKLFKEAETARIRNSEIEKIHARVEAEKWKNATPRERLEQLVRQMSWQTQKSLHATKSFKLGPQIGVPRAKIQEQLVEAIEKHMTTAGSDLPGTIGPVAQTTEGIERLAQEVAGFRVEADAIAASRVLEDELLQPRKISETPLDDLDLAARQDPVQGPALSQSEVDVNIQIEELADRAREILGLNRRDSKVALAKEKVVVNAADEVVEATSVPEEGAVKGSKPKRKPRKPKTGRLSGEDAGDDVTVTIRTNADGSTTVTEVGKARPRADVQAELDAMNARLGGEAARGAARVRLISTNSGPYRFSEENIDRVLDVWRGIMKGEKSPDDLMEFIDWNHGRLDIAEDQLPMVAAMNNVVSDLRIATNTTKQTFDQWSAGAMDNIIDDLLKLTGKSDVTDASVRQRVRGLADATKDGAQHLTAARFTLRANLTEVQRLAKKLTANPNDANLQAKLAQRIQDAMELQLDIRNAQTGAARVTSAGRINAGRVGMESQERLAATVAALKKGNFKELHELLVLASDDVGQTAKVLLHAEDIGKMTRLGNDVYRTWINGLLSGATPIVNLLGNAIQLNAQPLYTWGGSKLLQGATKIFKPARSALYKKEADAALRQWYGQVKAINDGFNMFKKAWVSSTPVFDPSYNIVEDVFAKGKGGVRSKRPPGLILGDNAATELIIDWPTRLLGASDDFYKTLAYRGRLYAKFVDQALETTSLKAGTKEFDDFITKKMEAHFDDLSGLPKTYDLDSLTVAQEQTFTGQLGPSLGKEVQRIRQIVPGVRYIIPFVRTPTQLFRESVGYIPGLNIATKNFRAKLFGGDPRQMARAWGQMSTGIVATTTVYNLAQAGLVTGHGPQDPTLNKQWRQAGNQQYSFKIGDKWISYDRLDPVGSVFGIAADMAHLSAEVDPDEGGIIEQYMVAAGISIATNLTNKTYLSGLKDFVSMIADPAQASNSYLRRQIGSAMPWSGFMGKLGAGIDGQERESDSIIDGWAARLPILRETLRPRRNFMGHPIIDEQQMYSWLPIRIKDDVTENVNVEISKFETTFGPPQRVFGDLDLLEVANPESGQSAYDRWFQLTGEVSIRGKKVNEALEELFLSDGYQRLPSIYEVGSDRAAAVRKVRGRYMSKAKEQMMDEFPEVREAIRQQNSDVANERREASKAFYQNKIEALP